MGMQRAEPCRKGRGIGSAAWLHACMPLDTPPSMTSPFPHLRCCCSCCAAAAAAGLVGEPDAAAAPRGGRNTVARKSTARSGYSLRSASGRLCSSSYSSADGWGGWMEGGIADGVSGSSLRAAAAAAAQGLHGRQMRSGHAPIRSALM